MYYLEVFVHTHMPYVVWACARAYTWNLEDSFVKLDRSFHLHTGLRNWLQAVRPLWQAALPLLFSGPVSEVCGLFV